ncbi:MAG: helix-turn-helix domain-containing protein [Balneolaceae bacterium]|nr:helix-turn-helix domain-containing protein [Balneolaceae bacterium]
MGDSQILHSFDESRDQFKPYGLTCELWKPSLMEKPDRHNEIEINYFPDGTLTYLFQEEKITIPSNRLAVFWGLVPHQIITSEGNSPYYVCTIPFSLFLEWQLPASFVDRILNGKVILEASEAYASYDEFLLQNWIKDIGSSDLEDVTLLEIRARLSRLAQNALPDNQKSQSPLQSSEVSHVERIAIYIGQNYCDPIEVSDIGEAVGLHPDYANSIFKKAFGCTLSEYIIEERISHAQRKLITTDANISSIAFECGFNTISWFNECFKNMNGCTPRDFRNNHRSSQQEVHSP